MTPKDILTFWFEELTPKQWFVKDKDVDNTIIERFSDIHTQAANGQLSEWETEPESCLALVIVLDQFSRNMFRGDRKSFTADPQVIQIIRKAIASGIDEHIPLKRRAFFYVPFMHSEDLDDQEMGIEMFEKLSAEHPDASGNLKYAKEHRDIVKQFGRFPHRNVVLGRESTEEEKEFLKVHSGF